MMSELKNLIAVEKEAVEFGFEWPNHEMIIDQVVDECREIKEAIREGDRQKIQEEIGDLLHAAIGLCVFTGLNVEETLSKTNHKFSKRMGALKILTEKKGLKNLQGQSIDFMLDLWREAKKES